jgi:hypothetical protein
LPEPSFVLFWDSFPEKKGKGAAKKSFTKALTKTSADVIMAGVERYKLHKPMALAWCYPATWLNQERWNDVHGNGSINGYSNGGDAGIPVSAPLSPGQIESAERALWDSARK